MKKLIYTVALLAAVLLAGGGFSQPPIYEIPGGQAGAQHKFGSANPNLASETCAHIGKDRYTQTSDNSEWYCSAINTWTRYTDQLIFNVLSYGAVANAVPASGCEANADVPIGCTSDGTGTDDTDAINDAIDAACTAGGGDVYIPPGDYRIALGGQGISGVVVPCGGITLRGDRNTSNLYAGGKGAIISVCENASSSGCVDPEVLPNVTVRDLRLIDDQPYKNGLGGSMYYNTTNASGTFEFLEPVTCTSGGPGNFYWVKSDNSKLVIQNITSTCSGTVTGTKTGATIDITSPINDTLSEETHGLIAYATIGLELAWLTLENLGDEGIVVYDSVNPSIHNNTGWQTPSTPSSGSAISVAAGTIGARVEENIIELGVSGGMTGGNKCISVEAINGDIYDPVVESNTCVDDDDGNFDWQDGEYGISVSSNSGVVERPSVNHNTVVNDTHDAGECSFTVTTTVGSLGSCGSGNDGEYKKVTDGADANDCSVGAGSDVHWCECVNPTWTARTETKNCDEIMDCYGTELCTGLMAACQGSAISCMALRISEGTDTVLNPHVEGNNINGRVDIRSSEPDSVVSFLDNQLQLTDRSGVVLGGETIVANDNTIVGATNLAFLFNNATVVNADGNTALDIGGGKAGSTGIALIEFSGTLPTRFTWTNNYLEADPTVYEEDYVNHGLWCESIEDSTVANSKFIGIHDDAIRNCKQVIGNRCEDTGQSCVEQTSISQTTVLGNTSVNSGSIDFYIQAGSDGNVVSGNVCEDSANSCVHVEGSGGGAYTSCVGNVSKNSGVIKCGNLAAHNCDASEADATSLCGYSIDF